MDKAIAYKMGIFILMFLSINFSMLAAIEKNINKGILYATITSSSFIISIIMISFLNFG